MRASRIDIGWAAWRACLEPAKASLLKRWAFRLKLWLYFGRAQFLVQVDNSYHTATSVRIRQQPEQDNMDILLIQSVSFWQCLRGRWQHRLNKPAPIWRKHLVGREVMISRYPSELDSAALPRVAHLGYQACAEVLLDGQHASQLPLRISSSH
ncbi:MAG: hypothetical protein ABIR53_06210 [Paraperlucidibaca sp.]